MESVYILWFVHEWDDKDREDDELLIGVYTTESDAQAAVERLKDKRGFSSMREGFTICKYRLNEDHWTEGYIVD
jgi:hypothetical protein